jgi:hypothetical protein
MAAAPKKTNPRSARTAQTGLMEGLDYPGKGMITPKKGVEDDFDEENVVSIDIPKTTQEEEAIASRQEKFRKAILTAKGGKKKRRSMKKTKKVKKHRKQK